MNTALRKVSDVLSVAWAAPCSAVGLAVGLPLLATGARVRRVGRTVEFAVVGTSRRPVRVLARLPWSAITLGHVVIGSSEHELDRLRTHELEHVRQYERWGVFLFLAYPLASAAAMLAGKCPYKGNWFEQQAIEAEHKSFPAS